MKRILFLFVLSFACTLSGFSQSTEILDKEEQAVLDVVNLFFESMTTKDTATLKSIMTIEGRYYGLHEQNNVWSQHTKTHDAFINGYAKDTSVAVERIWEPLIKVHKTIAMLWAPYDIYVNGKFVHCGVDAFSLIKTNHDWKIAGTVFTMEPDGCTESPLGPIKSE